MNDPCDQLDPLDDEWYGIRYSGEIPEVALHCALYYLTEDQQGPGLALTTVQRHRLIEAAAHRFREIVLRDLRHAEREISAYRGIERSIINWRRYRRFCSRQQLDCSRLQNEVAEALRSFLVEELKDVAAGERESVINCSYNELVRFADELGLPASALPAGIRALCC